MTDYWAADRLGRKQDAEFLYNFLIGETEKRAKQDRVASYVLNVDADWGGGKSFFLDGLAQDLEQKGHLVARVNAWRDDHAQDPYVAIMAAIDKVYGPYIKKPGKVANAWKATKTSGGAIAVKVGGIVLKGLVKKHLGVSPEALSDALEGSDVPSDELSDVITDGIEATGEQLEKLFDASLDALIEGFKSTDAAMTDFRSKLEASIKAVAAKKPSPLFILVDELDRCRPTYAVQLLERVKHLFDVPGVVFVFATNSAQLQHSISGAYGTNFDGFRYLKRFFDRTYVFAEPSIEQYVEHLCAGLPKDKIRSPDDALTEVVSLGCKAYGFDLRAIGHVIEMMEATASAWPYRPKIEIALLFPLCAHFYKTGVAEWPKSNESMVKWKLKRTVYQRHDGRKIDRSISFGDVYNSAVSMFNSIEKVIEASNRNSDQPSVRYATEAFMPEWNGVRRETDAPSVQTRLLGLVANAGRLKNEDDEEDEE